MIMDFSPRWRTSLSYQAIHIRLWSILRFRGTAFGSRSRMSSATQLSSVYHQLCPRIWNNSSVFLCSSYTGYIDIEARHIFFYFFESRNDPDADDVIFWTNGGSFVVGYRTAALCWFVVQDPAAHPLWVCSWNLARVESKTRTRPPFTLRHGIIMPTSSSSTNLSA